MDDLGGVIVGYPDETEEVFEKTQEKAGQDATAPRVKAVLADLEKAIP